VLTLLFATGTSMSATMFIFLLDLEQRQTFKPFIVGDKRFVSGKSRQMLKTVR
jgi:hypothetical protein